MRVESLYASSRCWAAITTLAASLFRSHSNGAGSETAEVHQMRVAACLHAQAARWRRCQICRHDDGRSAKECERRSGHTSEAYRNQTRDAAFVGQLEKLDGIAAVRRKLPSGLCRSGNRVA